MTLNIQLLEDMVRSRTPPSNESYTPLRELLLNKITVKKSDGGGGLQWLLDMVQEEILKTSDKETWVADTNDEYGFGFYNS